MAQRVLFRPIGITFVPRTRQQFSRSFSTVLDTPIDPKTQQLTPPSQGRVASVFDDALNAVAPRTNWTREEITEVYSTSLINLTHAAVCWCRRILDL